MAHKKISVNVSANSGIVLKSQSIANHIGKNKRILNAVLKLTNAQVSADTDVYAQCGCSSSAKLIDRLCAQSQSRTVCLNVTHEISCIIKNSKEETKIIFNTQNAVVCDSIGQLEIDYISEQIMHDNNVYIDVGAQKAGEGKINAATGNIQFTSGGLVYNGWHAGKNGVIVDNAENGVQSFVTHCGKGWKLGIEQYLVKRNDTDNSDVYTYIDGNGNYHEFSEKYYYTDTENNKTYVSKNQVNVDLDGKLTYNGYEVKTERRSTSGLLLETDYNGFKGSRLLEQRQDEQIELEENVYAYENQLKQYVVIQKDSGDTVCAFKKADNTLHDAETFISQCTNGSLILTESEAVQYNSLLLQYTSDKKTLTGKTVSQSKYNPNEDYSIQLTQNERSFINSGYDNKLANLKLLVKHLRKDFAKLTKKCNYAPTGSNPVYQYQEYYNFKKNCTELKNCLLDIIGIGKFKGNAEVKNLSHHPNGISCNPKYLHLIDNVCDLEEELQLINDDLETYYRSTEYDSLTKAMSESEKNDVNSWKYIERKTLLKEKENKMIISQLISQFQKNFGGRADKLQQNITDFETEISDFIEEEQRKLVDRQIVMLFERSEQNKTELQKYYKQYVNKKHLLNRLYLQLPVSYITSGSNIMGFNKYGQFVAAFDNYENQTAIIYEDGKIVSVKDTNSDETSFEYNADGLLCKITSSNGKITRFDYSSGLLTKITRPDGETAEFAYCTESDRVSGGACKNFELKSAADNYGCGVKFVYDAFGRITTVQQFTNTYSVSGEKILKERDVKYKTVAEINYKSEKATTVSDANGVLTTYVFDLLGSPVTVYEGDYADPEETTKAVSLAYSDNKQSYTVKENSAYPNLLAAQTAENTLNSARSERTLTYRLSRRQLPVNAANYVLSAWVKADSAYVKDSQKVQYARETSANDALLDTYQANRKFNLKAKVNYESGEPDVYSASFDWLNTDWQFLALPVQICADDTVGDKLPTAFDFTAGGNPRTVTNIELSIDYSYNTGIIQADCIALRKGDWSRSTFDSNGRKLTDEDSRTKSVTQYYYDESDRVIKQVLTDRQGRKYTNTYEYNKQGSLVRSTDYNGIAEETIFDEKGRELKKITYNINDPTSKFYRESKRDEKGIITADVDESGKYDGIKYTYDDNGDVTVQTDGKGNKTAYGYNDGALVSISGNTDGQESTNTLKYTAGLLTEVSNGDTSYNYEYDGWGRTKKVEIANKTYAETEYIDDNLTSVTLASGDIHQVKTDKYGNTEIVTVTYADNTYEHVTNEYDKETQSLSKTTIDTSSGCRYNITYTRNKDKIVSEVRDGEYALEKTYGYNADGEVESTEYKVGEQSLTYGYETDLTPERRSSKVQLPFNVEQNFAYDGLGRTKSVTLGANLVKDIYYAKYGDHATNRVNSVWHGVNGVRKDNVKYAYDKAGNITTVTENGIVVARYVYDGLNRLVREDNPTFGKKITYEYDSAGNILCKSVMGKKYRYTYPQNGWKDQLLEYSYKEHDGKEVIERFAYDSLGNPTVYRNKSLTWQGRRLKQFDGTAFTYDVNGIRTSKVHNNVLTKYVYDGNSLVAEQRGDEWIYYIYGVEGIAGFSYQGNTYLYRKNVQGDVTHIYRLEEDKTLTLSAEYAYDAWGNCALMYNPNGIAVLNPFRYRSYYFDDETKLYYLQTRYYDPELGRFISADSIEYLDPETLGGLNLYAYCGNNPVMATDSDGTLPEWLKWLGIGLAIVGAFLVVAAITILTAGVGTAIMTTTMAGAVLHGAAVGTLIGAGIGVAAGGIIGGATTNWSLEGILIGMGIGFGGGAIIGAVVGASVGALQYTNAVSQWGSAGGRTAQENMIKHFNKHVVEEGHRYLGKNVVQYTRNARKFYKANQAVMELTKSGNYVIRALFAGHNAGGFFSYTGLIFSFF